MKQVINSVMSVMAIFALSACGNENGKMDEHDDVKSGSHDSMAMDNSSQPAVKLKDDKLNAVYQHYVHLTTALINGDVSEAKIASDAIEAGAKEVNNGEALKNSAAKITAAPDLEAQRSAYSNLSTEFIALVKKSGLNSGEIYVDYCPMAMNDKGAYWLSANKAIRNPYFGDKMLTCGEVKETIK